MNSQTLIKLAFCGLLLIINVEFSRADVSHLANNNVANDPLPVTDVCLGCICEASSGCDRNAKCNGDSCGPFRITWAYWADGGKNTLNGAATDSTDAYANCANDVLCAASSVQGYMKKFGQDCNGDGVINCYDYAAIHKFGGYGCKGQLPVEYSTKFDNCINYALQQQG